MAAHAPEPPAHEHDRGAGLLPVFAISVVIATAAICAVVVAPSMITVVVALATVIGFAAGLIVLLSRLIGPEQH